MEITLKDNNKEQENKEDEEKWILESNWFLLLAFEQPLVGTADNIVLLKTGNEHLRSLQKTILLYCNYFSSLLWNSTAIKEKNTLSF